MFVRRVNEALQARDYTQGQLAIRSGLKQNHISQIVLGQREPGITKAAKLAKALGVSLDWLCNLPPRTPVELTPDEDEMLTLYRKAKEIAPEIARGILASARAMTSVK